MKDFDESYKLYCEELEKNSSKIVEPTKADFIKMYTFFMVVDHEVIKKYMDLVEKGFEKVSKWNSHK